MFENTKNLPIYSYSKVKSYYNCPYYFFENYFEKSDDFELESHGTSEFGSYVHKILEMYEKDELEIYELLDYYEDNYLDNVKSTFVTNMGKGFYKDLSSLYYEGGKAYFENFAGFDDLDILESEYEFYEEIDNSFILNGKIDLVALDKDGKLLVIDHKSKGKFKNKAEKREYATQLYLYSYAVFKKYNRYPDKLAFNMFRQNEWVWFDFDEEEYTKSMDWLIKSVDEIENSFDFEPILDTFFCNNFCGFRNVCKYKCGGEVIEDS